MAVFYGSQLIDDLVRKRMESGETRRQHEGHVPPIIGRMIDPTHPLTHAGALAVRTDRGGPEYLVVSSSDGSAWVLPKGHIEPGEEARATALRELEEEAGVRGSVVASLPTQRFHRGSEEIVVGYYLVRVEDFGASHEGRELRWESEAGAMKRLTFEDSRAVIREALAKLQGEPE